MGPTGPIGPQGPEGLAGLPGQRGEKGDKGDGVITVRVSISPFNKIISFLYCNEQEILTVCLISRHRCRRNLSRL